MKSFSPIKSLYILLIFSLVTSTLSSQCTSTTSGSSFGFNNCGTTANEVRDYPFGTTYPAGSTITVNYTAFIPTCDDCGSSDLQIRALPSNSLEGTDNCGPLGNNCFGAKTFTFTASAPVSGIRLLARWTGGSPGPACGVRNFGINGNVNSISFTTTSTVTPPTPTGSGGNANVCSGGSYTFPTRTCASGTLRWYDNAGGTGTVYSGSTNPPATTTYYPFCFQGCNGSAGNPATATIINTPNQPSTISGTGTVCSGSSQTYSVTNVAGVTYSWSFSGGGTPSSTTNSVTFSPTSSGTLSVTATNSCGTSTARTRAITVNSAPSTPGTIAGSSSVCSGSSQTYTISAVAGATSYTWSFSGGGTATSTTNSVTFTPTSTGTLSVTATNSCGTSAARTRTITVNSAPSTPGAIAGSSPVCPGSSQTYSVSAVAGASSYNWSFSGGGTATSSTNSVTFTPTSTGTLSVTATNSCGTSAVRTRTITVSASGPSQPGTISGLSPTCSSVNQTYSIAAVSGATSYTWSYSGGGTPSGTGTSVTLTPTSGGVLSVIANNSCGSSTPRNRTIVVTSSVPTTPGSITGTSTVCSSSSQTYSVGAVSGATSYTWAFSGGGTASSSTNTVTFNPTSSGNLTVTANNVCGSSSSSLLAITVDAGVPSQPSTISGTGTVCNASSQTYSVTNVAGVTYAWSYSGGGTPSSTTNSVTFNPTSSGTLSVTATNTCGTSTTRNRAITVDVAVPSQPSAIAGTGTVCNASSQTYSVTNTAGVTYSWSYSGGGTPSSTTNSVTFNPTSSGTLSVTATNACGTSTIRNRAITVDAAIPSQPSTISGTGTVCNASSQTYSVTNVAGVTYAWSYSGGGTPSSTTNSVTFNPTSSGTLSVTATNSCGTSTVRNRAITVDAAVPSQPSAIAGTGTVCNASSQTYSVTNIAGVTYSWSYSGGGTPSSTTNSVTFNPTSSGTLSVTATNSCGTSTVRNRAITVDAAIPNQPSPINGTGTVCTGLPQTYSVTNVAGVTYAWSYSGGGTPSSTTNSVTFNPTSSGTLSVTATNTCGTSATRTLAITVIATPVTPGAIAGNTNVCAGNSETYNIAAVPTATTYNWTYSGTGTPTGSLVSTTFSPTTTGVLMVSATNACGTSPNQNLTINVTTPPAAANNTTPATNICEGTNKALSGTPAGGSFSIVSGIGSISGGLYSAPLTNGDSTVIIRYTIAAVGSCPATNDDITFIVNNTPQTANNTTANTDMCETDTRVLSATPMGGTWSVISGGGSITGSTYTPANITTNTTVTIRYTVADNGACLGSSDDVSFVVNYTPGTANNTTSTADICETDTKTLTASPAGGTWSIVTGGGTISGSTYTPPTIASTTAVTIRYSIPAVGVCSGTTSDVSFNVNDSPGIANNTTDPSAICQTDNKILTATPAGGNWSVVFGGGTISGATYTPGAIAANTLVIVRYTIPTSGGCFQTFDDSSFVVNLNPGAAVNSTTTTDICESDDKSLIGTPSGGSWSIVSGGGTISGSVYTPANITANTPVTTRYTINANGACASTTDDVTFTVNNETIVTNTTSSDPICSSEIKSLTASPAGGNWSIINGGGTITGTTYSPAAITAPTNVTVRYSIVNSGCDNFEDITFTVNPSSSQPTITPLATGSDSVCSGSTITLTATVGGGNTVAWYNNNNPQPNTASGVPLGFGNSITLNPTADTRYYAFGTNAQTCQSVNADSIDVFVYLPSSQATSISSTDDTVCAGQGVTLTVNGGFLSKDANWVWYANSCGLNSSIGSGGTIAVSPSTTTLYYVRAEGLCDTTLCSQVTVTVQNSVDAVFNTPDSVCLNNGMLDLSAYLSPASTPGGVWSGTAVTDSSFDPASAGVGSFVITYTVGNLPCQDVDTKTITVYSPLAIQISDDFITVSSGSTNTLDVDNNDLSRGVINLNILPKYGSAYIDNNEIVYLANPNYRGNDTMSYTVCDVLCLNTCDTATIILQIDKNVFETNDNGNIGIWGLTPNNDGVNDVLYIDDLYKHPNNKITIYNRWGDQIFNSKPYNNNWDGGNSTWGTYYFIIEFLDENELYKGVIHLKQYD